MTSSRSDPESENLPRLARRLREFDELRGMTAQQRGILFNEYIADLLRAGGLRAQANLRGELGEIDVGFTFDHRHFILEAKWLEPKVDYGAISFFSSRVRQRIEGTLGIFVSMSGYTRPAIENLKRAGDRPRVLLFDRRHVEALATGKFSTPDLLRATLREASVSGDFYNFPTPAAAPDPPSRSIDGQALATAQDARLRPSRSPRSHRRRRPADRPPPRQPPGAVDRGATSVPAVRHPAYEQDTGGNAAGRQRHLADRDDRADDAGRGPGIDRRLILGGIVGSGVLSASAGTGLWLRGRARDEPPPAASPSPTSPTTTEVPRSTVPIHMTGNVSAFAVSRVAEIMAVGTWSGDLRGYKATDPFQISDLFSLQLPNGRLVASFSPRGDLLAVGVSEGDDNEAALSIWQISPDALPVPVDISKHPSPVHDTRAVAFSADGQLLITGQRSGLVIAWTTADWKRCTLTESGKELRSAVFAAFAADGRLVVLADSSETVSFSRPPYTGPKTWYKVPNSEGTTAIAMSPDGRLLATAADAGDVQLRNLGDSADMTGPFSVLQRSGGVSSLTFSDDGGTLAVGSSAGDIELWNVAEPPGRLLRSWEAHRGKVQAVRYLSDRALASGTDDMDVKIWGPL